MNHTSTEIMSESIDYFEPAYLLTFITISLVLVTAYYAIQTRKTVKILEYSAKLSIKPIVKFYVVNFFSEHLDLEIRNLGNGPALKLKTSYVVRSVSNSKKEWSTEIFAPKEKERFLIRIEGKVQSSPSYFKNHETIIDTRIEYEDMEGEKYDFTDTINVTEQVEHDSDDRILKEGNGYDKISRMLEKIAQNISYINKENQDSKS